MLQVRANEISRRKWSGGIAQLRSYARTLEGIPLDGNIHQHNQRALPKEMI